MPMTLEQLMAQRQDNVACAYAEHSTMLYALAIGMGHDPFDETELEYVYERRGTLRAVPSQALTVARHNLIYECGLVVEKMLHGEQVLTLHQPLPPAAQIVADHQVRNVFDTFSWDINISQLNYQPEEQRRYLMTLAVDF